MQRADRRAHCAGIEGREAVAEIAGRDDEARLVAGLGEEAGGGISNIGHLRHQPTDADAVGRGQVERLGHRGIGEGGFREALAIVEIAIDLDRPNRGVPAGQLMFLEGRDAALGIEDHRADRSPALRRAADRAAGIARGRGKDGQRVGGIAQPVETGHQEARAEILEGAGRAVEQFEHAAAVGESFDLDREVEGAGTNGVKVELEFVAREEGSKEVGGEVGKAKRRIAVATKLLFRQVKSAVGGGPGADCLSQRDGRRLAAGRDEACHYTVSNRVASLAPALSSGAR